MEHWWPGDRLFLEEKIHSCDTDSVQESKRFSCFVNFGSLFFSCAMKFAMEVAKSDLSRFFPSRHSCPRQRVTDCCRRRRGVTAGCRRCRGFATGCRRRRRRRLAGAWNLLPCHNPLVYATPSLDCASLLN